MRRRPGSTMTLSDKYVIGIDFGTLSGRALLVRVSNGEEIAFAVHEYKHAVVDTVLPGGKVFLPPDWALQVPQDYRDVLMETIPAVLKSSGVRAEDIIAIATDFTACTVLPVNAQGTPICELKDFEDRPHAYAKLWRHHSAQSHADRINDLAHQRNEPWIHRYGGKISSEWEFAKGLQLVEEDPEIYELMDHWIEGADWIVWQLCGQYVKNICTAGYKAIYQDGDYPSPAFLEALNPKFGDFVNRTVRQPIAQLGERAGYLTEQAARWTGLLEGTPVAVGNVDAHVTVAAANAVNYGQMVAIMGSSTCHVMISDKLAEIPGMCGVVDGGIVPGQWGYEAGQSGVGEIFGWFANNFSNGEYETAAKVAGVDIHTYLSDLASKKPVGSHGLVALDWESGNRSTLVDHRLSGLIVGLTLVTRPEDVYQAIVESTAFGTRKIIETFERSGVQVVDFITAGGLTKNKFVMQIYSDILKRPIHVVKSEQGPALGSAIHAAVAAGAYVNIQEASAAMGSLQRDVFTPRVDATRIYDEIYLHYEELYDFFGSGKTMHSLSAIRDRAFGLEEN
jgi:L-ribulokinase